MTFLLPNFISFSLLIYVEFIEDAETHMIGEVILWFLVSVASKVIGDFFVGVEVISTNSRAASWNIELVLDKISLLFRSYPKKSG